MEPYFSRNKTRLSLRFFFSHFLSIDRISSSNLNHPKQTVLLFVLVFNCISSLQNSNNSSPFPTDIIALYLKRDQHRSKRPELGINLEMNCSKRSKEVRHSARISASLVFTGVRQLSPKQLLFSGIYSPRVVRIFADIEFSLPQLEIILRKV